MSFTRSNKGFRWMLAGLAMTLFSVGAQAQKKYDTGASDTEIKLGNLAPYSGPVASVGGIAKAMAAYFDKINAEGGINGRKIRLESRDDGYNPAMSVELTRQLVERDGVLAIVGSIGTAQNAAVEKYLNARKVPQLFLFSASARWNNPKQYPWTMGWLPVTEVEGRLYAQHILATKPQGKVAVLLQNDDFGRDYLKGLMEGLGEKGKAMVVAQATYEPTDPTVDSQIISLKGSGADVLVCFTLPKASIQAIRKTAELDWKPKFYVANAGSSVQAALKPAGFKNSTGIISANFLRDPTDPAWKGSRELADYLAWMKKYNPSADPADVYNVVGLVVAQTMEQVLRQAGDNLTRENLMKQAANLNMQLPMMLPGVRIKTSPTNFQPVDSIKLTRFNGESYELVDTSTGR